MITGPKDNTPNPMPRNQLSRNPKQTEAEWIAEVARAYYNMVRPTIEHLRYCKGCRLAASRTKRPRKAE